MTDTQADLTERARAVLRTAQKMHLQEPLGGRNLTECEVAAIAAALQSAREAAAAEAERKFADEKKVSELYHGTILELERQLAESEAAAAEERRAAIEECERWNETLNEAYRAGLEDAAKLADPLRERGLPEDVRRLSETIRALASSPPEPRR